MNGIQSPTGSASNLKIVKTEVKPTGEAVQLVRPIVPTTKSTDQIVGELVNRFDYKTKDVKANENELNTVQQAFGSNLAQELIKSYDGSNLVADSQQDLVGERYLAEQIRLIQEQQRTTSVLDKWSHLLYEGEKDYRSSSKAQGPPLSLREGYDRTVSNASNYSLILEQQQAQAQQQFLQQLQEHQQQQQQFKQQPTQSQISQPQPTPQPSQHSQTLSQVQSLQQQLQQLRTSQSANLAASASYQRLANAASQNSFGNYVHSQSGLNGRTLSDIRIAQAAANAQAQVQAAASYRYETESQANAHAHAQALAQARTLSQVREQAQAQAQAQAQLLAQAPTLSQATSKYSAQQAQSQKKTTSTVQQPQVNLPSLSSSNLNSVSLEAYNSPQFKAMLEQLSKPINIPPEQINYPPEWPSQDKINLLAEPIYIPAPQPIVIPAPSIITLQNQDLENVYNRSDLPEATVKPTVTYYPSIESDQNQMRNFGIRQINLEESMHQRTGSNLAQSAAAQY